MVEVYLSYCLPCFPIFGQWNGLQTFDLLANGNDDTLPQQLPHIRHEEFWLKTSFFLRFLYIACSGVEPLVMPPDTVFGGATR